MSHGNEDEGGGYHQYQHQRQVKGQEPNTPLVYNRQVEEVVGYKECLKNHAASIGGNALDGCGEFMPSIDPFQALKCSACGCHRNFHRKEVEGQCSRHQSPHYNNNYNYNNNNNVIAFFGRKRPNHNKGTALEMTMQAASPNMGGGGGGGGGGSTPSESTDHGDGDGFFMRPVQRKKRFRTKFSQEQKEKLLSFAEKAGWKMQKLDESAVQQFCQEIGIKRKVLKVWMHNNKQNYVNKNLHF